jgi:hypothetical protein
MANTLITPTALLNEAGRLFHQKAKFIGSINRQYDDRFAQSGAKVGTSILLRDRNAFTVTTGATMNVQNVTETSQTLTVGTQKHVAMNFTSADLTMTIDDFSERYIVPAVAALVANVESDALISMRKKVYNFVDNDTAAFSYLNVAQAKQKLDETLTPDDSRTLLLCPTHATKYLDASKGFYNPSSKLGGQYDSGMVKDFTGFDVMATTHATAHQTGTAVGGDTLYNVNGANQTGSSLTVDTGTTTILKGDIITLAGLQCGPSGNQGRPRLPEAVHGHGGFGRERNTLTITPAITVTAVPSRTLRPLRPPRARLRSSVRGSASADLRLSRWLSTRTLSSSLLPTWKICRSTVDGVDASRWTASRCVFGVKATS